MTDIFTYVYMEIKSLPGLFIQNYCMVLLLWIWGGGGQKIQLLPLEILYNRDIKQEENKKKINYSSGKHTQ